jgi:hypothetical protein
MTFDRTEVAGIIIGIATVVLIIWLALLWQITHAASRRRKSVFGNAGIAVVALEG